MSYTPIKLPNPPLSFVDGESLALDLQTAATGAGGTQVGKTLNFTAYISSFLSGDYAAASQDKKEVMARIYFQVMAEPATDFDTQYTAIYSALYP